MFLCHQAWVPAVRKRHGGVFKVYLRQQVLKSFTAVNSVLSKYAFFKHKEHLTMGRNSLAEIHNENTERYASLTSVINL
jgi:hypothetical protein